MKNTAKRNKVILKTETRELTDVNTGLVLDFSTKTTTARLPAEDDYIKLYITDICILNDLPKGMAEFAITLIKRMAYDGTIALNSAVKDLIINELKDKDLVGSKAVFDNKLSKLSKAGILLRIGTGLYKINPFLFGKGKWEDIYQQREHWIKINYKDGIRSIETAQGVINQAAFEVNKQKKEA